MLVPCVSSSHTGSCASNGGSTFYFDPEAAPLDNKSNKLWFTNGTAAANGSLVGNGANDGFIRTLAQQGKRDAVKSMVLVDMKTQSEWLAASGRSGKWRRGSDAPGVEWSQTAAANMCSVQLTQRMGHHATANVCHCPHMRMCLLWCRHAGILACCDLQPAGPASTNWTKSMPKGKVCDEEEGHGAHKPATKLTNGTMANGTMADDDHAGHDHAGHDHDHDHDHAANATTKPATAATAKSAACAMSAGVLGAAAAAALVLLAL